MLVNEGISDSKIAEANLAPKELHESSEKPVVDYENEATGMEREVFDIIERLTKGVDLLPEYAKKGQKLLVNAREDIGRETKEFMRQLRDALDIAQPNHRPNKNALPLELGLDEVVKPRAGDSIRFSLDHDIIGPNYVDAYNGYMFDTVKENYIKAQDAYKNGDKARGDMLMKNTELMAAVIIQALESGINESRGLEWGKKRPEDIFDIVRIEMQQDAQRKAGEAFSKN